MPFDPTLAAIRFGTGLSPLYAPPASVQDMIDRLAGPDDMARMLPIPATRAAPLREDALATNQAFLLARNDGASQDMREPSMTMRDTADAPKQPVRERGMVVTIARGVFAPDGFRERLLSFWASHFTVVARGKGRQLVTPYVEAAIRPHLNGRFGDMLQAVVLHPMMLGYLDQRNSVSPKSRIGMRSGKGLNENLARELLELHLMGVDAGYTQTDVTELARLLAGLTVRDDAFYYDPDAATPGSQTVMGMTFLPTAHLGRVTQALDQLALHPATAQHIARRLAVHFVSDDPDPDLVAAMAARYAATKGDLTQVCDAMLTHPAAWVPTAQMPRAKVKTPVGFLQSSLRALGVPFDTLMGFDKRSTNIFLGNPMRLMAQTWEAPTGPDGWAEAAGNWITPQGMAARINWAMTTPERLLATLPDPRDFVHTALGEDAPAAVVFAAGASETVAEGVGVVLASAAFQRR